jgi:hypothetical protein
MAIYSNITVDQGSDYFSTVYAKETNGLATDLTGYTARGQVRKTYSSLTSYKIVTTIVNPESGSIEISLSNVTTSAMKAGRYVYDIEVVSPTGIIRRVVEGQLEVMPSASAISGDNVFVSQLVDLVDVDATNLEDGAILIYNSDTRMFELKKEIDGIEIIGGTF